MAGSHITSYNALMKSAGSPSPFDLSDQIIERIVDALAPDVAHYLDLSKVAHEKDAKGRLTKAAKDARQTLRNPYLNKTHVGKAKQANNLASLEALKERDGALADFIAKHLAYSRIRLQGETLDGRSDGVPLSRESPDETLHEANTRAFVESLMGQGVPPSAFARLTQDVVGPIAEIMKWAAKDPGFEDPNNLLRRMVQVGLFEGYSQRMDIAEIIGEDAFTLLGEIAGRFEDPTSFDALRELEERLGRRLDLPPGLAPGLLRLHQLIGSLSENQLKALRFAAQSRWSQPAVQLTKLLGLSPAAINDVQGVLSAIMCLRTSDDKAAYEQELALIVYDLSHFINDLDFNLVPYEHWPVRFAAEAISGAKLVSRCLPNEQAYNHLLAKLVERSIGAKRFKDGAGRSAAEMRSAVLQVIIAQLESEHLGAIEYFVGESYKPEHLKLFARHMVPGDVEGDDEVPGAVSSAEATTNRTDPTIRVSDDEGLREPSSRFSPVPRTVHESTQALPAGIPKLPSIADLFKDDEDD